MTLTSSSVNNITNMTQPSPSSTMASTTKSTTTATAYFFNGTTDGGAPSITFNKTSNLLPRISKTITVHDFRSLPPTENATLTTMKCELVPYPTTLREANLKTTSRTLKQSTIDAYYAECAALVKSRLPGCARALAFHHRHREQTPPSVGSDTLHDVQSFANKPVATFHVDNDSATAERHLRRKVGDQEAETEWLADGKRWGIVNVWRPVGDIAYRLPLALAVQDESSLSPPQEEEDKEETMVRIKTPQNYKTHFIGVRPLSEAKYKFWYASRMTPDEALVFMDYDSATGEISGVAHGAVEDHDSPLDAPLRRSIEVRVLVLYE
ncbi:methyltransferase [Naviculisporaceae sp. PSN 640]